MEQNNELLQDAATTELSETTASEAAVEESSDVNATDSEDLPAAHSAEQKAAVTDAKATIKIEGQEFELEAELAQDDKLLKTILQPHFAAIENCNITRDVKEGRLTVSIVKRAQHKGAPTWF